jgi:hypothetical protein
MKLESPNGSLLVIAVVIGAEREDVSRLIITQLPHTHHGE